ncbi:MULTISPECIES: UDP-N-acetylmuramoyl-tripeptide--D-alanyl-D-alanine ligase [Halocynthiibacter]|uniref:UDP-N-acetylmuramoyl-tripeptide--D-alanyl-D-alanine ligase n=1 Tax=Halocynthiibacter halioticoli TaxID=2986804 RepID=A0AAE3LRS4_9RHOB|nr:MULTISPECIES: UDP-N-acetylmuramoyl-tripeptide--D-alanyl-D-alanine ligase [Halocynthiibacter]MCV6824759.1 UDP-N-acetylmuramoyl-tripeptide--D-alanyl-D-alanine ligase [Halocynthiibacter halioticoli]MCW4057760.1 UDP-N-acetylmuramoyl-tripeptide--D-alanyl-D-alanine ligase [Halocynthiibacter sp. SDUM655004]
MTTLWTQEEAVAATGGEARGDWAVTGVSIDTRTIAEGDLFVALKAARDGHDFVAQALAAGASAALVSRVPDGVSADAPLLIVPDVLTALEDLGRAARARTKGKVIAVTGSVGKTSTKEMLRTVLARQGKTHAAEASYNNHWGVPLTLARMPADTDFAVIEIGMNHPGEIAPLTDMARPHVAMVTTVAAAHLEAFENIQGIAREKAAIFDGLVDDGTSVVNADLETTDILLEAARGEIVLFGASEKASYRLLDVQLANDTTIVSAELEGQPCLFKLSTAGRHFATNAIGVLACVAAAGGDLALASADLAHWVPPSGRGTRETVFLDRVERQMTLEMIDDAFNANPTSMEAALEVLAASTPQENLGQNRKGRRVAFLGDMLELGENAAEQHAELANFPMITEITTVHCIGPLMRGLYDALPLEIRGKWAETAAEIAAEAHELIDAGDVVLVKGSKGSKTALIVDAIRKLGQTAPTQE